jgi:hypothetical protein
LPAVWTARYEAIRQQALEESRPGNGGALLQRSGVAIWMRIEPIEASMPVHDVTLPPLEATPALPAGLSQEITRLLVNLFLDQTKEDMP